MRLGVITHLSGAAAPFGNSFKAGVELAAQDLGTDWISVSFEDDEFSAGRAVTAFQTLLKRGVDVVLCSSSTPCSAIAPLAEQRAIPLIAWASDDRISRGRRYVLRNYPSGAVEGRVVAEDEMRRGVDKMALVISQNAYSESWAVGVREVIPRDRLVFDEQLSGADTDVRSIAAKVLHKRTDSVGLCVNPGQNAALALQLRQQNYRGRFFGCAYLSDPNEIEAARGSLDGATYPTPQASPEFAAKLSTRSDIAVPIVAANAYDAVSLLKQAWTARRLADLSTYLLTLPQQAGAAGPLVVRNSNADVYFDFPIVVATAARTR